MWAGRLQSPRLLWLLLSPLDHRPHCYVVLPCFAGGSYPVPLASNCPALGAGVGGSLCGSPRKVQHEKVTAHDVTSVQEHRHGV